MTYRRWSAANYLLPIGSLVVATMLLLDLPPVRDWPLAAQGFAWIIPLCLAFSTVFVVLHHAENVARRVGEPYGTLLLTLAVTAIEVSVIVSLMLEGENNPTLARESVFSTVMIVSTGVVGTCLFVGGLLHHKQDIRREGTNSFLAVLIALAVLSLVLPDYTLTADAGSFSALQLGFVAMLSVLLYGAFLFSQMVRHQDDFLEDMTAVDAREETASGHGGIAVHVLFLIVGLVGIVLLAEQIASGLEAGLAAFDVGHPDAVIGAFIATLVLMPESVSAIRAALRNEPQRSLNIALGSACATIGLTIPAVATVCLVTGRDLTLGLGAGDMVLLLLALTLSVVSFGTGRTNVLTGLVHLVVFLAYLLLIVVP